MVPRPRLSDRLSRGIDARLTLVSAPAGFGKTTLLVPGWLQFSISLCCSPSPLWTVIAASRPGWAQRRSFRTWALMCCEQVAEDADYLASELGGGLDAQTSPTPG